MDLGQCCKWMYVLGIGSVFGGFHLTIKFFKKNNRYSLPALIWVQLKLSFSSLPGPGLQTTEESLKKNKINFLSKWNGCCIQEKTRISSFVYFLLPGQCCMLFAGTFLLPDWLYIKKTNVNKYPLQQLSDHELYRSSLKRRSRCPSYQNMVPFFLFM